jgi:hypothetical protein
MTNAIFISEDYLKENTIINGNVDNKYLLSNLKMIEDVYVHPLLGSDLYDELKDQVTSANVTVPNRTLIEDYIQPTMIYYLLSELPYDMVYKWENKSIVKKNSDFSQPVELNEIEKIAQQKRKIADFYAERMTRFLCANDTVYPLYASGNSDTDDIKPIGSMYPYSGIYLGGTTEKSFRDKYNNA